MIDLKELAKETVSAVSKCHVGHLVFKVDAGLEIILEAFKKLNSEFVDELLAGEARWTEAQKTILKIVGGGMEYKILHDKLDSVEYELNKLAKDRWEVIQSNGRLQYMYVILSRKKMKP